MSYLCIIILGYWVMLRRLQAFEMKEVHLGDSVEIECNISFHHDITWLRMKNGQPPLVLMVTSLISDGAITITYQDQYHGSSTARVKGRFVAMTIKNISVDDLGLYYCTRIKDKVLTFGAGVYLAFGNEKMPPNMSQSCNRSVQCEQGPMLPPTGAHLSAFGLIYMAALVCGLLTMIGAVITVHHQTRRDRVH